MPRGTPVETRHLAQSPSSQGPFTIAKTRQLVRLFLSLHVSLYALIFGPYIGPYMSLHIICPRVSLSVLTGPFTISKTR